MTVNFFDPAKNFAVVEVSTGYDASATSVALVSGDGAKLPAPATEGAFNLVWWNSSDYTDPSEDPDIEIVRVTARSTDTLTIVRPAVGNDYNDEGSENTASAKNVAGKTYKMMLAWTRSQRDRVEQLARGGDTRTLDYSRAYAGALNGCDIYAAYSITTSSYPVAICQGPNTGKYILLAYTNASPYIRAVEIDPSTKTVQHLTLGGGSVSSDSSAIWTAMYCSANSTVYLYARSSTTNSLYPITFSGTSFTVGTAINPSTYVPTSSTSSGSTVVTTDGTYIYYLITYTGEIVRYTISGGAYTTTLTDSTWAQTGNYPPAYTTFGYSDGYLYRFSTYATTAGDVKGERYSIAGNSWASITMPSSANFNNASNISMCIDPTDQSEMYLTMYQLNVGMSMYKYNGDANTWTEYGTTQSVSTSNFAYYNNNSCAQNTCFMSITDQVAFLPVRTASYYQMYANAGRGLFGNAFSGVSTLPTAGAIIGVNAVSYGSYGADLNTQLTGFFISRDGGAIEDVSESHQFYKLQVPSPKQHMNLTWDTSLKVYLYKPDESAFIVYLTDRT